MKTDLVVSGILIHDNKVLLIHHRKLDLWLAPGGHIEKDELPDDAVKREFLEETGIEVELLNRNDLEFSGNMKKQLAVPFYVNVHSVGDHDHCCFYYICTAKNQNVTIQKKEIKDFKWFSEEDLESAPADVKNICLDALNRYNQK